MTLAKPASDKTNSAKGDFASSWFVTGARRGVVCRRLYAMLRMSCRVLGMKSPRGLGLLGIAGAVAVVSLATPAAAQQAFDSNGIFINANWDGQCTTIGDDQGGFSVGTPTFAQDGASHIKFRNTTAGCSSTDKASQTNRVLFYRPNGVRGVGATSLSLGGELYVNGNTISTPNHFTVDIANTGGSIRIGNRTAASVGSIALGDTSSATGPSSISFGYLSEATGEYSIAVGNTAKAINTYATAFGSASNARGDRSVALGASSIAATDNSVAVGRFAQAQGINSVGVGRSTIARGLDSTALGFGATTTNANTLALGTRSSAIALDSVAMGLAATSEHDSSVALGANSRTDAPVPHPTVSLAGTSYDFAGGAPLAVVSVGSLAQQRQIINVGAGRISADSTDATNGSQLFAAFSEIGKTARDHTALQAQVDALAAQMAAAQGGGNGGGTAEAVVAAIGPGASVSEADGSLILPAIDLASAGAVDRNGEPKPQPTTILGAIDSLDDELVKQDRMVGVLFENALLRDEENPEQFDAQNSKIANVAPGTALTDAVNLGQLEAVRADAANALEIAELAQRTVSDAETAGREAQMEARRAVVIADLAQDTAENAQTAAAAAQDTADGADGKADAALAGLGGGAAVAADGTVTPPSYGVAVIGPDGAIDPAGSTHNTVGDALDALGGNVVNLAGVTADQGEAIAALNQNALLWDDTTGAFTAARDGAPQRIANVAAGTAPTDAVNVSQLQALRDEAGAALTITQNTLRDSFDAISGHVVNLAGVAAEQGEAIAALNQNALLWNDDADAFTAARNGAPQQIANVAAGTAPTDAVNVSQLETLGDEAMSAAEAAQAAANAAQGAAETAQAAAEGAQGTADAAQNAAQNAQSAAEGAQTTANAAQAAAIAAQTAADGADGKADAALAAAEGAQTTANAAQIAADGAQTTAEGAQTAAQTAQRAADGAQTTANAAQTAADGADGKADAALAAAEGAQNTADAAQTAASTAQTTADSADGKADAAQTAAEGAQATANAAQTAAAAAQDTANGADGKADAALAGLGGGAAVAADGTVTPPSYGVAVIGPDGAIDPAGSTHNTVGDALDALGNNVVNLAGVTAGQGEAIAALNQNALLWSDDAGAFTAARNGAPQQIANVAAGTAPTDAVNVSQLEALDDEAVSAAEAAQATANAAQGAAQTAQAAAEGAQGTADAAQNAAQNAQSAAEGAQGTANAAQTAAAAAQTAADGANGKADAAQTAAQTAQNTADAALAGLGGGAAVAADGTVTPPTYGVAVIGPDGAIDPAGSTHNTVGAALDALGNNVVNLAGVTAEQGEAIAALNQNALLWSDDAEAFTAARNGAPQQIANVAAGTAPTDAVNVGQLVEVSDDVAALRQTTGQELSAANDGIARLEQAGAMAVTYDAAPGGGRGNTIGLVGGDPNAPVLIANVARGSADNDAVNVQHLNESQANTAAQAEAYTDRVADQTLASANHYTDSAVSQVSNATSALARDVRDGFGQLASDISAVSIEAKQAAAIGLAASSLRFNDAPGKLSLAAGGGFWQGQGALALGLGYTSENGDVRMNLTGVTSGGHIGVGGGFSVTLN